MLVQLRAALAALLLAAAPASAQCIGIQCATGQLSGQFVSGYGLDGQPAPSGAYALKRLLASYTTNRLVRLRRSSDNAELDIGFLASGAINTAAASAHCAATLCFLVTFYDQSGHALDLTQATPSAQLAFIFNCQNGYPCMEGVNGGLAVTGPSVTPATGIVSISVVGQRVSGTSGCTFFRENGASGNRITAGAAANIWGTFPAPGTTIPAADGVFHSATGTLALGATVINLDGVETTGTTTVNTTAAGSSIVSIAATTCRYISAVFWDNVTLTAGSRATITSSNRAWWGF